MKQQFYKLFLISLISLSAPQVLSAQLWELFLDPLFLDGIYYAVFKGPNEPTWEETTFARFPYDEPNSGLYLPTTLVGDKSRFHAVAHFQNNERRTSGGLIQIKYTPISVFTAEVNYLQLFDKEQGADNRISLTSFSLSYNRLRHHRIHFWWGIGGIFIMESADNLEDGRAFTLNLGVNYYFKKPLKIGDPIILEDMMHYTMVKTTMFNGVKHPDFAIIDQEGNLKILRKFTYQDFKRRLG